MAPDDPNAMPFDARGGVAVSNTIAWEDVFYLINHLFSWIKRFTGYYDVVALVMLSTFIVTQCFLLYTLQNPLTRNSMSFVVFMAGAFIIFALCLFGELITIEVSFGQGGGGYTN